MGKDVVNGDVYIFISKRRNAIKLLCFDGDDFAMYYKRNKEPLKYLCMISARGTQYHRCSVDHDPERDCFEDCHL
ncbi:IS66 Orf2 like protein [Chitinophaga sp. S165]|nr:IS66 Orf2 like protein [Chitinophaga sp. S165]